MVHSVRYLRKTNSVRFLIILPLLGLITDLIASVENQPSVTRQAPSPDINVPQTPPSTSLGLINAFPVEGHPRGALTFDWPVAISNIPGDSKRLFICEKAGIIRIIPDMTAVPAVSTEFFNLASINNGQVTLYNDRESGLHSVAFHPNFTDAIPEEKHFFVHYSIHRSGLLHQRVSRFTSLPDVSGVLPGSEVVLIERRDEAGDHIGGDIHFGPDGYLYISLGDEGGGKDVYLNSQRIDRDFFSGILRIDVDKNADSSIEPSPHPSIPLYDGIAAFSVPKTNPYVLPEQGGDWDGTYNGQSVSGTVRTEFWATGLRNPWRMAFDPVTGTLWCPDVGQELREEVNQITRGGNYGWVYREGTLTGPRTTNPPIPDNFDELYHAPPVYEYPRAGLFGGTCVIGGLVYRGTALPQLTGKYVFADHVSGHIWTLEADGSGVEWIAGEVGIVAFGTDPSNGDILMADMRENRILRMVSTTPTTDYPATLSETGLFSDLASLTPSSGVVPYAVNLPFWSDHAIKQRWFTLPDANSTITPSTNTPWLIPTGTILVKHFDMEMQRGNPESLKRIETRILVKTGEGAYGVSYRWNNEGTEAFLAEDRGESFNLAITDSDSTVNQLWRIPSRSSCLACHTPQAGYALSLQTRQLNREYNILGIHGNQLVTLKDMGYFSDPIESPNLLPRHFASDDESVTVEARVRSYLAVNCGYCHNHESNVTSLWDASPHLTLHDMGIVDVHPLNHGSDISNRLIAPGDPSRSVILSRMAESNGFSRMPPLGNSVLDLTGIDLLNRWITGDLTTRQNYAAWRIAHFDPHDQSDSEPDADADGDGHTNYKEFLAGTDPHNGGDQFRPTLVSGNPMSLEFKLPTHRSFLIETSSDLETWTAWDVAGNDGRPTTGDEFRVEIEDEKNQQFFRIKIEEN